MVTDLKGRAFYNRKEQRVKVNDLTSHEIEVLQMLAGEREVESGAWVNACFEFLQEFEYCTRIGTVTDKGREFLNHIKEKT